MKKYLYLIGCALAAVAISACNKEETPTEETTPGTLNGTSYMGVQLTMTGGSGTRAESINDQKFETGSDAENAIVAANALFLFYDGVGNYLTYGQIDANDSAVDENGYLEFASSSNHSQTKATVILGPTKVYPSQVLAVLNCTGELRSSLIGQNVVSLADALQAVTSATPSAAGSFVMANSVYLDTTDPNQYAMVIGQPISPDQILTSRDSALKYPVTINVEREIAKVRIKVNHTNIQTIPDGEDEAGKYYQVLVRSTASGEDGVPDQLDNNTSSPITGLEFRVVIDGWSINAINTDGYVVKHTLPAWEYTTSTNNFLPFTDPALKRSYWSADKNYNGEVGNWDVATSTGTGTYAGLQMKSWNEVVNAANPLDTTEVYYHENTVPRTNQVETTVGGGKTNVPALLVAAHVEYRTAATATSAAGAWTDFEDDLFYSNQYYMTRMGLRENIAQYLNEGGYEWIEDTTAEQKDTVAIDTSDFSVRYVNHTDGEDNSGRQMATSVNVRAKNGYTLYRNGTEVTLDANGNNAAMVEYINSLTLIANGTGLVIYRGGACYYQMPIHHWDISNGEEAYLCGIVRNHIYRLTINSFSRIGGPIGDKAEDLPVIPGESDDYYIAAQLNVLNWVVKEQAIDF